MTKDALTPMMRQYHRIKAELAPGVLLLFRMGDFYELFHEDARQAAPLLGVALTQRNGVPMCGVPWHALESYLARLIRAGRRAAICEQTEDPAQAKGLVRREVERIVTPGTVTEETLLDAGSNRFLASLGMPGRKGFGLALMDLSTGDFSVEIARTSESAADLIGRYLPGEILFPESLAEQPDLRGLLARLPEAACSPIADWFFEPERARETLLRHFKVVSLDGFGCEHCPEAIGPAGAALEYVRDTLRHKVAHVRRLRLRDGGDFLALDASTCRHLDLIPPPDNPGAPALLGVLDATRTPMGARALRHWLLRPLCRVAPIRSRLDAVQYLTERRDRLSALRDALKDVRDIERMIARIGAGRGNARDLRALEQSMRPCAALRTLVIETGVPLFAALGNSIHVLPDLMQQVDDALVEQPPATLTEGGLIRDGFHAELDGLRSLAGDAREWVARYQAAEQERTGIRTLKVRHNRVFGYYIDVTRAQSANVPPEYERKQTLVNNERFITPELKRYEEQILGAQSRATALEASLFESLRQAVAGETERIQETARALARLDVLGSLADRALALGYSRPDIHDGDELMIREGRHPVIEQIPESERFVPNDTCMNGNRNRLIVITGPNMAGKSTYIRQVAVMAVMAHMGAFVPAAEARISLLDRVFTRVGASDDLARGRSTFMVEMQETANILNNATGRSLIVLDEIGRGTSTFDGISIAWSVAEYLHNAPRLKAKTLFATHYHELTDLALTLPGVRNYTVRVKEQGDGIVFLRRIEPGTADKSYGIQVAKLAGLPQSVIERAREILSNLEEGELEAGLPKLARKRRRRDRDLPGQLPLFEL